MEWLTKAEMRKLRQGDLMDLDSEVEIGCVKGTVGYFLHNDTYTFRDWFDEQVRNKRYFTRSTYRYIQKVLANEANYRRPLKVEQPVKESPFKLIWPLLKKFLR